MKTHRILWLILSLAWSLTASAQWQWIDKDGRKVYSDRPPPSDVPDKSVLMQPGGARSSLVPNTAPPSALDKAAVAVARTGDAPASAASAAASSALRPAGIDKELEARKKQAEQVEADQKKADEARVAKARAENCRIAQQAKATMDSGIRVAQINAKGERVILDDVARAAETKRAQTAIASECK